MLAQSVLIPKLANLIKSVGFTYASLQVAAVKLSSRAGKAPGGEGTA
jgi:hypothetical protein